MVFEKNDLMGLEVEETPLTETELALVVVRGARGGPMVAEGCQYVVEKGSMVVIVESGFS